jgi:hypothetical protein
MNAKDSDEARWQIQLTWELVRHSASKELAVSPGSEKQSSQQGKQMVDRDCAGPHIISKGINFLLQILKCSR